MDADEEALFEDWENDALFNNFPDDSFLNPYNDDLEFGQSSQVFPEQKKCSTQVDIDMDYALALSLQSEINDDAKENENTNSKKSEASKPLSIVDEQWELIDPHPDIHALFIEYDNKFFYGKLKCVEVRWSPRMTLCAGICSYQGRGGLCSIGLSQPLLKLRPRRDLVETLLHEMIHAYLFVTANNKDRDGHGPEFLKHMYRINKESGTNITVYHSFHAEVNVYKTHWWKCDGPCRNRSPFFGLVKRAMNRAPGPNDNWWADHQRSCGGKFIKIKEPSNYAEKKRKLPSNLKSKPPGIQKFIKSGSLEDTNKGSNQSKVIESPAFRVPKNSPPKRGSSAATDDLRKKISQVFGSFIPFQGTGQKLGTSSTTLPVPPPGNSSAILKDLHIKKTNFPSYLPRNAESTETSISAGSSLMKKVTSSIPPSKKNSPPCSSSKASATKKLFSSSPKKTKTIDDFYSSSKKTKTIDDFCSSSPKKTITLDDSYSSSPKKTITLDDSYSSLPKKTKTLDDSYSSSPKKMITLDDSYSISPKKTKTLEDFYSSSPKIPTAKDLSDKHSTPSGSLQSPRISNVNKDVQSGLFFSSKASSSKTMISEMSDFENSVSPRNEAEKSCDVSIIFSSGANTKLFCPVCCNAVDEEINAHLDKCLKS